MTSYSPAPRPRSVRRLGAALVAALALFGPLAAATAAHAAPPAAILSLEIDPTNVTAGDPFTVTITGSAVSDLYSYDLELTFDPALVEPATEAPTGPAGGFTSTVTGPGTLTVSHTRLGTSPGLSGEVVLASVPLRSLAAGSAVVELSSVRLVSSTGDVVTANAVASGTVVIAAVPVPEPQPSASSSPTPSVSASATATPAPAAQGPGDLATTGIDATPWFISGALGVALLAGGTLLVLRRRQAVRE